MSHELGEQEFEFVQGLALSHIITHNLNTSHPDVTVYEQGTSQQMYPTVTVLNLNQVRLDWFVPRAITGKVD